MSNDKFGFDNEFGRKAKAEKQNPTLGEATNDKRVYLLAGFIIIIFFMILYFKILYLFDNNGTWRTNYRSSNGPDSKSSCNAYKYLIATIGSDINTLHSRLENINIRLEKLEEKAGLKRLDYDEPKKSIPPERKF